MYEFQFGMQLHTTQANQELCRGITNLGTFYLFCSLVFLHRCKYSYLYGENAQKTSETMKILQQPTGSKLRNVLRDSRQKKTHNVGFPSDGPEFVLMSSERDPPGAAVFV